MLQAGRHAVSRTYVAALYEQANRMDRGGGDAANLSALHVRDGELEVTTLYCRRFRWSSGHTNTEHRGVGGISFETGRYSWNGSYEL